MMINGIILTPDLLYLWKKSLVGAMRDSPHAFDRVISSINASQLQSKLWIVNELNNLNIHQKSAALLGGWYAHFTVPLLLEQGVEFIHNFEIDEDVKRISYKFNKEHKDNDRYKCDIVNVMFEPIWKKQKKTDKVFDLVINTSCEHMFPMKQFHKLNRGFLDNPIFVLQSTNENKYEDHINCVNGPEELAEQSELVDIMYSGAKTLDSGMERFMVIGK